MLGRVLSILGILSHLILRFLKSVCVCARACVCVWGVEPGLLAVVSILAQDALNPFQSREVKGLAHCHKAC